MYFSRISLHNFGPIATLDLELPSIGVSLITGPNASGKTHLACAFLLPFLGQEVSSVIATYADSELQSLIEMEISESSDVDRIEYSILKDNDIIKPIISQKMVIGSSTWRKCEQLTRDPYSPIVAAQSEQFSTYRSSDFIDKLATFEIAPHWLDQLFELLTPRSGTTLTGAKAIIASVAEQWYFRQYFPYAVPFAIDSPFNFLGDETCELLFAILRSIGETSQVVVLSTTNSSQRFEHGFQLICDLSKVPATKAQTQMSYSYDSFSPGVQRLREHQNRLYEIDLESAMQNIQASLTRLESGQDNIQHSIDLANNSLVELRAKADELCKTFAEPMEIAIQSSDLLLVDKLCSDLATTISRMLRSETTSEAPSVP